MVARILYHYTERDLTTPSAAQAIGNRSNFPPSFAQLTWVVNEQGAGPFLFPANLTLPSQRKGHGGHPGAKSARDIPFAVRQSLARLLNMSKIGIASAKRDQSPIRSRSSHWRKSPLKPMLSATRKDAITHRSIACRTSGQFRISVRTSSEIDRGEKQIGRAHRDKHL